MTGARYIESLKDGREVWIDGERVEDVTVHPAFKDMIDELARVYDLQNSPKYRDEMTFVEPETGVRTSVSWLLPRSAADLKRKRRNSELWNELTWGQLGRSPDILAPYIISGAAPEGRVQRGQASEMRLRREPGELLQVLHAQRPVPHPCAGRPAGRPQRAAAERAARSAARTRRSRCTSSRKPRTASSSPAASSSRPPRSHSNECYVSLSATFAHRNDPNCVLAFAIPTNSPGLKILAREPVSRWFGSWGHPLQMLDEQDCMLFFDRVLVPWDRLFMLYDPTPMIKMLGAGGGSVNFNFLGWANLCRAHFRMRLMTAVATMVAEAIGVIEYREVAAKLGEMVTYCEVWRHAMDGVEHEAGPTPTGQWRLGPGRGLHIWFAQISGRMIELLREICGSGIIMQPSERDLANPGAAQVSRPLHARQGCRRRVQVAPVPSRARPGRVVLRHAPGHLRVLARRRPEPQPHQPDAQLRPVRTCADQITDLLKHPLPHGEVA